jgi:hypothetical protein
MVEIRGYLLEDLLRLPPHRDKEDPLAKTGNENGHHHRPG